MPAKRGRALEKLLLCRIPASAYLSALCPPSANSSSFRHPRGRIERRGGSLLLRWIFQNQMLSRGGGKEGAKKGSEEEATKAKGLGTRLRGMPSWYNPRERSMNHPTSFPTTGAATPAPQLHNFSRQLHPALCSRSLWTLVHPCSPFRIVRVNFFFGKRDFYWEKFFTILFFSFFCFGKQKFAERKKIGFKWDELISSCSKLWREIPFSRIDVRKPQHPRNPRSRRWQRVNENRSASIRAFRWKFASLPGKNFPNSKPLPRSFNQAFRPNGRRIQSRHGTRWRNKERVWREDYQISFPFNKFPS